MVNWNDTTEKISQAFPIYESQLAALETSTARTAHTVIVCRLFSSLSLHCSSGVCMGARKHNTSTQSCCDRANCDGRDRDTRRVAAIEHFRGVHTSNSTHFIHHTHTHLFNSLDNVSLNRSPLLFSERNFPLNVMCGLWSLRSIESASDEFDFVQSLVIEVAVTSFCVRAKICEGHASFA